MMCLWNYDRDAKGIAQCERVDSLMVLWVVGVAGKEEQRKPAAVCIHQCGDGIRKTRTLMDAGDANAVGGLSPAGGHGYRASFVLRLDDLSTIGPALRQEAQVGATSETEYWCGRVTP